MSGLTLPTNPTIAIIGAGAVGGYYGARLAQHGHDVHFLLRSDFDTVKSNGWTIRSVDGDFSIPADRVHAYQNAADLPKVDLAIIATKSTSNAALPSLIEPVLHDRTLLLTLQNGIGGEQDLAGWFGERRVVGGMAFVCINRGQPGEILHLDHGLIRVGPLTEATRVASQQIVQLFKDSKIRCELIADLRAGRWLKLVWNVPFNGLGAALDLTTDRLLADPHWRQEVETIMHEVIAAAAVDGVTLPADTARQQIDRTPSMGAYRTSMQIDRQMGRPLEIEAIVERPLKIARAAGLASPAWERLLTTLKR